MKTLLSLIVASMSALVGQSLDAQTPADAPPNEAEIQKMREAMVKKIEDFGWKRDGSAPLGTQAQVQIPTGYRFTSSSGTRKMLELFENIPSHSELGMLTTEGLGPWIIFEFDEVGFVKDDDKDSLDADDMLATLKEGQEQGNEQRKKLGMEELELVGWAVPPRYNAETNNLEWATRIKSKGSGGESINYNTRLLGRNGVMEVGLVCAPDEMDALLPDYQKIMAGFSYKKGSSYAEYREGDKLAQGGLAALVVGGAAVAAGKMGLFAKLGGLLAKLGKGVILLAVAVFAGIRSLWNKLVGRNA